MADKKISALTASSVPLAGTEVLPIVQSGATVKVAVSDLTAGRTVSMSGGTVTSGGAIRMYRGDNAIYTDLYNTTGASGGFVLNNANGDGFSFQDGAVTQVKINNGNVVISTSGKGIDFSATSGTGTSELLADYEEGTWTPTITPSTSGAVTYTTQDGTYTKVGRQVTIVFVVAGTKNTASGEFRIGGIPFNISGSAITGAINWYNPSGTALVNAVAFYLSSTQFRIGVITAANTDATAGSFSSAEVSSTFSLTGTLTYFV